jgi:ABC-type transporter Mla subunit MlaD
MPQTRSHIPNVSSDLQHLIEKVDLLAREMQARDESFTRELHNQNEKINATNHTQDNQFDQLMTLMNKLHTGVTGKTMEAC